MANYSISDSRGKHGPYPPEQLPALGVTGETLLQEDGTTAWLQARMFDELAPHLSIPVPPARVTPPPSPPRIARSPRNTFACGIIALAAGILSVLTVCFDLLSISLGLLAVVCGILSLKTRGEKMGVAGFLCAVIPLLFRLIILIYLLPLRFK